MYLAQALARLDTGNAERFGIVLFPEDRPRLREIANSINSELADQDRHQVIIPELQAKILKLVHTPDRILHRYRKNPDLGFILSLLSGIEYIPHVSELLSLAEEV